MNFDFRGFYLNQSRKLMCWQIWVEISGTLREDLSIFSYCLPNTVWLVCKEMCLYVFAVVNMHGVSTFQVMFMVSCQNIFFCSLREVVDMWTSCSGHVLMQVGLAVSMLTGNRW